jgi:hypothetical protein
MRDRFTKDVPKKRIHKDENDHRRAKTPQCPEDRIVIYEFNIRPYEFDQTGFIFPTRKGVSPVF